MNTDNSDKRVNRGIAITSVLLVIVIGSVIGFILYIRGQHLNRQEHMNEVAKEVAVQDSINRLNAEKYEKEELAREKAEKAREAEKKAMESYVKTLVEQSNAQQSSADIEDEEWEAEDIPATPAPEDEEADIDEEFD